MLLLGFGVKAPKQEGGGVFAPGGIEISQVAVIMIQAGKQFFSLQINWLGAYYYALNLYTISARGRV